jgi:hypothetical protein
MYFFNTNMPLKKSAQDYTLWSKHWKTAERLSMQMCGAAPSGFKHLLQIERSIDLKV